MLNYPAIYLVSDRVSEGGNTCARNCIYVVSEALVAESMPETLSKEKEEKLIINMSNCEKDNCESVTG